MVKRFSAVIGCLIFLLALGCSYDKKEADESDVQIKDILIESTPGCKFDSMQCAQVEISYPVFPGLDTTVQAIIKNTIASTLNGGVEGQIKSIEDQGNEFVNEYKEYKAETRETFGRWYRSVSVDVISFNDSLLSLQVTDESFAGGAHGSYATSFINLRTVDGKAFGLSDFFKPGYEAELKKSGEEAFRSTRELADTASFEFNGYSFDDNAFGLNHNYGFRQDGIVFYYNSYEVAPYSMGPTEVVIPYERMRSWIRTSP
jgi:Protein of unknown function (DUF3298)/Deacetylase PdaC